MAMSYCIGCNVQLGNSVCKYDFFYDVILLVLSLFNPKLRVNFGIHSVFGSSDFHMHKEKTKQQKGTAV